FGLILMLLLDVGRAYGPSDPGTQGTFSRSDWIARRMRRRVPFSGGVIPNLHPLPVPARPREGRAIIAPDAVTTEPVRVDHDLLDGDTVAQQATYAEPYLAANPANPDNLLAGYQQNRFTSGGARAVDYAVSSDGGQTWSEALLPGLTVVSGGPWQKA